MPPSARFNLRNTVVTVILVVGMLLVRIFAEGAFDYVVIGAILLLSLLMVWHSHT
jgi:hypothetical protein